MDIFLATVVLSIAINGLFLQNTNQIMKKTGLYRILAAVFAAILLFGCGEDRTYEYLEMTKENQWTYSKMKEVYLWADSIKPPARTDFFAATTKFFTSLKYKNDLVSFFTDTVSAGTYGMTCAVMRDPIGERPSKTYALVLNVEPDSPASLAGIRRGTWITAVGGRALTTSNTSLLQSGAATQIVTEYVGFSEEKNSYYWAGADTLQLAESTVSATIDIPVDRIFDLYDRYVGYMFVGGFAGENFKKHVAEVLDGFASANVSDIIIDLRYCSGGSMENAAWLASSLVPADKIGTPFCTLKGNGDETKAVYDYEDTGISLGDKSVYFIIGNDTKGVSELLVTSLNESRAMNDVITLGKKSAGANVMVEEFASPYGFSINPATAYIYTSGGMALSAAGISPDYSVNELATLPNVHELGMEQEFLLYNSLYLIVNGTLSYE